MINIVKTYVFQVNCCTKSPSAYSIKGWNTRVIDFLLRQGPTAETTHVYKNMLKAEEFQIWNTSFQLICINFRITVSFELMNIDSEQRQWKYLQIWKNFSYLNHTESLSSFLFKNALAWKKSRVSQICQEFSPALAFWW